MQTPVDESPAKTQAWERDGWGLGALPAVNFNSDEGFGFGAIVSVYRYDGVTSPYKWSSTLMFFMTTKQVHFHRLSFDALDLAGGKLRLDGRVVLSSSRAENYCGLGGEVSCDPAVPEALAESMDFASDEERDEYLRRYYKTRFVLPYGMINARYKLSGLPHKVELVGGARVVGYIPGDLGERDVYEGSLYADDYPDGESGVLSVLQAGIMLDNRDFEPAPTSGYWIEATVRGAAPYWGSSWSYFGFNTTARGYVPILPEGRLVLADRLGIDGIIGDAPTKELATPGGVKDYDFWGGASAGRGIRLRRYRGRATAFNQAELRWRALSFETFGIPIDITLLGFLDVGYVALEWSDLGEGKLLPGQGVGLRLAIDQNFIVRVDVGFSALEDWSPGVYIDLDHLF